MALMTVTTLIAAAAALTVAATPSRAQTTMSDPSGIARLERMFWVCDHAASTRGVDAATMMACMDATEALKARKFGGDFDALLTWWREGKAAAHAALDAAAERAAARVRAEGARAR